ncbi:RidA family protein [Nocardioides sp.]|uniref:RidA family protein n=1 Tax=Nocardioides sp. TaxID=35761 RepID=UPI002734E945|nr:RidA family protein [Nocardioides sp.]MDP3891635.1 RidA family protein [Nocardioides sp.]
MPSDQSTTQSTGGLPDPPRAQGAYRTATAGDHLVMTAGMTPRVDGVLQHAGRLGESVTLAEGRAAAAIAASNAVAAVVELLGSADAIGRALRMTVYVNAVEGFTDHSRVADGASQRLVALLGEERGAVVRSAVGVASLPGGACVEVELTCLR